MRKTIGAGLIATVIGLVITGGLALWAPSQLEAGTQVPVHWGPNGPDRFADASVAGRYLWILPGVILFSGVLLGLMPFLDPFRANLEQGRKAYKAIWVSTITLLVFIQLGWVAAMTDMLNAEWEMVRWIMAASSSLFIIIGNYLPKTRASFIFGIRTPWTLTSDTSWEKTHRLGGRLFMFAGVIGIIGAFTLNGLSLAFMLPAMLLPIICLLTIYSYLAWRKAEDQSPTSDYIV